MEKANSKKLAASVVLVVASIALLLGLTFAWFTDSAKSTGNKIQAGTLGITATYADVDASATSGYTIEGVNGGKAFGFEADATTIADDGTTAIISETLWEPGKSSAKLITVTNNGSLAAKVKLSFEVTQNEKNLVNALWCDFVQVENGSVTGSFEKRPMSSLDELASAREISVPANGSVSFILFYGMNESAGNEYQGGTFGADVTILATQDTVEKDGFGSDQYDKNATYPVTSESQIKDAFANAQAGDVIQLANDIEIKNTGSYGNGTPDTYILAEGVTLDLNGNAITVNSNDRFLMAGDNITVKNGTIVAGPMSNSTTGKISYSIGATAGAKNVVFESMTIDGGVEALGNGATLTLRNCSITATNYYTLYAAGGSTTTIENCTLKAASGMPCIFTQTGSDKVIVNSATLTSANGTPMLHDGQGTCTDNR
ncbi:MAG: SipW-dependent-type signal peptide-containing protein [Eggerthellaceae bacterium]|nr:SipW-dependent-type signal peptide-containing protein [Eggerthellaceae bacterium]